MYDIYRSFYEKVPEDLGVGVEGAWARHYMGFTLKLMCTDGGWDAGANALKVLLHQGTNHKGVAKVQLFGNQEFRLFVWLRGGGIAYHIRSPIDLNGKITIYMDDNAVAAPAWPGQEEIWPAVIVSPIAVGNEDPNLVKTGVYDGWGFGLQVSNAEEVSVEVDNLKSAHVYHVLNGNKNRISGYIH